MRKPNELCSFLHENFIPSQNVENIRVFRARSARKSKKFRARSARKQSKRNVFCYILGPKTMGLHVKEERAQGKGSCWDSAFCTAPARVVPGQCILHCPSRGSAGTVQNALSQQGQYWDSVKCTVTTRAVLGECKLHCLILSDH